MQTTIAGLSAAEAARRLETVGRNEIPAPHRQSLANKLRIQLTEPLVLVLLAAAVLTIVTGDVENTVVNLTVVILNSAVGVSQEQRADRAVAALGRLSAPVAAVVRDGLEVEVPVAEVVPGDVVALSAGDVVPADAELLAAHGLQLDESALSGESLPVERSTGEAVQAGTVVTRGRGRAVVTATGARSALGGIGTLLATAGLVRTPLQRRLAELSRLLAIVAGALCGLVLVLGLLRGESLEVMVVTAISLAVAAVPESLPVVTTLALALGARRMARHHALVRRLGAVETLGLVTVLATDKTGTLTEGRMVADEVWAPGPLANCDAGARDTPAAGSGILPPDLTAGAVRLLEAVTLCNDRDLLTAEDGTWEPIGDPTETAMLVLATRAGIDRAAMAVRCPRLAAIPFDSERRRMTTIHQDGPAFRVVMKGARKSSSNGPVTSWTVASCVLVRRPHGWSKRARG